MKINSTSALLLLGCSAISGQLLAQQDPTIEQKKQLNQQKEQLTHASDFKSHKQQQERRLFSSTIKKDDDTSQRQNAQKNN